MKLSAPDSPRSSGVLGELIYQLLHTSKQEEAFRFDRSCIRMIRIKQHIATALYNNLTDEALDEHAI